MHKTWESGDPVIQLNFPNPLNVSVQVGDIAYFSNPNPVGQVQEWTATTTPHMSNHQSGIIMIGEIIQRIEWDGTVSSIICQMPQALFNQYFAQIVASGCITTPDTYTGDKIMLDPIYDVDSGPPPQGGVAPFSVATSCTNTNVAGHQSPGFPSYFNYDWYRTSHGASSCGLWNGLPTYAPLSGFTASDYLNVLQYWSPPLKFFFEPGNENLRFDEYVYTNHASITNGLLPGPHLMYTSYYTPGSHPGWAAAWPGMTSANAGTYPYANIKFYTQWEMIEYAIEDFTVNNAYWTTGTFGNQDPNFLQAPYHGMTWEEWTFFQSIIIPSGSGSGFHSPMLWGWVEEESALTYTENCTQGSFIMFSKDNKVNMSDMLGYYASVELRNNSKTEAELFNVGTTFFESSK